MLLTVELKQEEVDSIISLIKLVEGSSYIRATMQDWNAIAKLRRELVDLKHEDA